MTLPNKNSMKGFIVMKKLICLLLALVMLAAALSGCVGPAASPDDTGSVKPSDTKNSGSNENNQGGQHGGETGSVASLLENAKIGDTFEFGKWEQDGKNGGEPIKWIVLCQDVGKALVLSDKILECDYFKKGTDDQPYQPCLYKDSDVRAFLTGEFYNNAFSDAEKSMILTSKITTEYKDEHYNELTYETEDKVFALSRGEAARYVCGAGTAVFGLPTKRIEDDNPYEMSSITPVEGIEKVMSWWLRDMVGDSSKYAAVIYASNTQKSTNNLNVWKKAGVRPAMWIVYNEADMNGYAEGKVQPKADAALDQKIAALKIGDRIEFGSYDVDPYSMNGYERLVWTVVDADDESFTLIATDTVAKMEFMTSPDGGNLEEATWAESDIRKYVNSVGFIKSTFTPQEEAKLLITHVKTSGYDDRTGGDETDDRLFIPDVSEINKYLSDSEKGIAAKRYWLRSPESWAPYIAFVYSDGTIGSSKPTESLYVRLMVRIKK